MDALQIENNPVIAKAEKLKRVLRSIFLTHWHVNLLALGAVCALILLMLSLTVSAHAAKLKNENETDLVSTNTKLHIQFLLKEQSDVLFTKLHTIDTSLSQLNTSGLEILMDAFNDAVMKGEYGIATQYIHQISDASDQVLSQQDEIIAEEIVRSKTQLEENLKTIDLLLGNSNIIDQNAITQLPESGLDTKSQLYIMRDWVKKTVDEIKRRRAEMDLVQKQIIIDKSEKRLAIYENGNEIYSMPVSLGRGGSTHSGDFSILDKLGTVWSYWQIWLPQWMGIYNVGVHENGIHGLPFDDAGNVYWVQQVGKQNITYGCVMPDDKDMNKLYEWAEVGIPVTIIE